MKLKQWAEEDVETIFRRTKRMQQLKFERLAAKAKPKPQHPGYIDRSKFVVNLSDRVLQEHEKALLSRGLNFSITPSKMPKEDIIANTEALARRTDENPEGGYS